MRNRFHKILNRVVAISLLVTLCLPSTYIAYAEPAGEEGAMIETEESERIDAVEADVIIGTAEEFLVFAKECSMDSYSLGKTFALTADIDLVGKEFTGVPYFNGTFLGNGHTISNVKITEKGSQYGLFRYIGESALVVDLSVNAIVMPEGSQAEIGGIVGVNYGTIKDCYYKGRVYGLENAGGIAGRNASTGQIIDCATEGLVMATNRTGGIAGVNEGVISGCTNQSRINIEELEPVLDIEGMDISDLNVTQTVVTRNNMGGIVGTSNGVIRDCHNHGEIGYAHTGYNVGGIAGSQSGIIIDSTNDGKILGRKDVGGIVGQAEPYIDSEYLSDQIGQLESDVNHMNRTVNHMMDSLEDTATESQPYVDALNTQYSDTAANMANRIEQMGSAVGNNEEVQSSMNNIKQAMQDIQNIQGGGGSLTDEQLEEIRNNMQTIGDNTNRLQEIVDEGSQSISWDGIHDQNDNADGLAETLVKGVDTIADGVNSISNQIDNMANRIESNANKEFVTDISSLKTASELDGVVSSCVNRGTVEGDLNVGGITGTMNVEYEDDPEMDFDSSSKLDIATSSEINDVIISCTNYGKINAKKNCAGSVVGLHAVGYIYGCEGYGHVKTNAGSYVGGITGWSRATIEKCYAMLDLTGEDYVGGISGMGASIIDCLSVPKIEAEGERVGSVAGYLEDGGTVESNYFVKTGFDAIDKISYAGVAEPIAYDGMMQLEGVPEGFTQVQVAFVLEDEIIAETTVAYGSSLTIDDFPVLEDREDAYVAWPDESEYTDIKNNLNIEAEYTPWVQSVASNEQSEEGKPILIIADKFYEGTELVLEEVNDAMVLTEDKFQLYAYDWELSAEREKEIEVVEAHFYLSDVDGTVELWIEEGGNWTLVDYVEDGSYLVANIPYGAMFSVIEVPDSGLSTYVTISIVAIVILLVISSVIIHNKRRNKTEK